jgi:hypothetical protein
MVKIKLTDPQKKMLMTASGAGIFFAAVIILAYLPMHRHLVSMKREYRMIDAEMLKIREMAGKDKSLDEVIAMLKKKLDDISTQFPAKEEGILKALSERANGMGIKIEMLNPAKKRIIESLGASQVKITGCSIQEIDIMMKFQTNYAKLVGFLVSLKEDFPFYIKIVSVNMVKKSEERPALLDIELRLRGYLVTGS